MLPFSEGDWICRGCFHCFWGVEKVENSTIITVNMEALPPVLVGLFFVFGVCFKRNRRVYCVLVCTRIKTKKGGGTVSI